MPELEEDRYVVKVYRSYRTTVMFVGSKQEAMSYARNLNTQYQTDEYKVEKFDKEQFFK